MRTCSSSPEDHAAAVGFCRSLPAARPSIELFDPARLRPRSTNAPAIERLWLALFFAPAACWYISVGGGDLAVAQVLEDFQNFAPRRELAAAAAFVEVHRLHELDLLFLVVAFTGCRVDLSAAFDLDAAVALPLSSRGSRTSGGWRGRLAAIGVPTAVSSAIDGQLIVAIEDRIIKRASFALESRLIIHAEIDSGAC